MRPSLQMLADRPLESDEGDRLGFGAYANALAELIDNPATDTPLTLAISAAWGAGKTSLAKIVQKRLVQWPVDRGNLPHIVVWFNAWMHDDAPHLGAAFAADVAKNASRYRRWWWRIVSPLPTAMLSAHERWRRRALWVVGALVLASVAATTVPGAKELFASKDLGPKLQHAFGPRYGSIALVLLVVFALWSRIFALGRAAASFVDDPRSEAARGSMQEVADQLGRLLRQATLGRRAVEVRGRTILKATAGKRRLVIFVDDLERCRPPRAIEVCEVASQLLAHPDVVTVLIADMEVIATSAAIKYADLEQEEAADKRAAARSDYGRFYLQKMVQIQFNLPTAEIGALRAMLHEPAPAASSAESRPAEAAKGEQASEGVRQARVTDVVPSRLAFFLTATLGMGITLFIVDRTSSAKVSSLNSLPSYFVFGAFVLAILVQGFDRVRALQARKARRRIDVEIEKKAQEVDAPEELEAEVLRAAKGQRETLVRQRVQRYLTDESALRKEAESEILKFLPPLPRSAKRMLNHLRVLLAMAVGRQMLGPRSPLRPSHLGKWVVLTERWPDLAQALSARPTRLRDLERAATVDDLKLLLEQLDLDQLASEDLRSFLRHRPSLAAVLQRLVFLQPAAAEIAS